MISGLSARLKRGLTKTDPRQLPTVSFFIYKTYSETGIIVLVY